MRKDWKYTYLYWDDDRLSSEEFNSNTTLVDSCIRIQPVNSPASHNDPMTPLFNSEKNLKNYTLLNAVLQEKLII